MPEVFGNITPYCEPSWYGEKYHSPYYKQTHKEWRDRCRKFVDEKVIPNVSEWEREKKIPLHVYKECFEAGLLPCVVGKDGFKYVSGKCKQP